MSNITVFSMHNVTVMLDGAPVQGLAGGDNAIEVSRRTDASTLMIGADGDGVESISKDRSHTITIRLQHTSSAHRRLQQRLAQRDAGRISGFPFSVRDTGSGEGFETDRAGIATQAAVSIGVNATERVWTLHCATGRYGIINQDAAR